ncbi:MAG: iron-sulfur cluster assembly scaffold protein [Thermoplasmata archaeon]
MASDAIQAKFLDHYLHPRNFGPVDEPHVSGTAVNPQCGDRITIHLVVDPSSRRIVVARFEGAGCMLSIVSASLLTEWLVDRPAEKASRLGSGEFFRDLEVPFSSARENCALVSIEALKRALQATGGLSSPPFEAFPRC